MRQCSAPHIDVDGLTPSYPYGYAAPAIAFLSTPQFDQWLRGPRDPIGKARITVRIRSAQAGNFGDCAPVGVGISEMRVHVGPGYRVYFARLGDLVYLLLCSGDKASQKRDIGRAKALLNDLESS